MLDAHLRISLQARVKKRKGKEGEEISGGILDKEEARTVDSIRPLLVSSRLSRAPGREAAGSGAARRRAAGHASRGEGRVMGGGDARRYGRRRNSGRRLDIHCVYLPQTAYGKRIEKR